MAVRLPPLSAAFGSSAAVGQQADAATTFKLPGSSSAQQMTTEKVVAGSGRASASKNRLITDFLPVKQQHSGAAAQTYADCSMVGQPVFENTNLVTGSSLQKVSEFSVSNMSPPS